MTKEPINSAYIIIFVVVQISFFLLTKLTTKRCSRLCVHFGPQLELLALQQSAVHSHLHRLMESKQSQCCRLFCFIGGALHSFPRSIGEFF